MFGGITVPSAILAQSFMMVNFPWNEPSSDTKSVVQSENQMSWWYAQ